MDDEVEKAVIMSTQNIIEYVSNSIVVKFLVKKITCSITAMAFDKGQVLKSKTSPFDIYLQIVMGNAEIIIDKISHQLLEGSSINYTCALK